MKITESQKHALSLLENFRAGLDIGWWKVQKMYNSAAPDEVWVPFEKFEFCLRKGYNPKDNVQTTINGVKYYVNKKPTTISRKVIGELINKGLCEVKIETSYPDNIYVDITNYGRKVLSEQSFESIDKD